MGFMDKAKKMAEQAQAKLDEAQKQFNSGASGQSSGPVVEYDDHGRPIAQAPPATATPPHGDPLGASQASPPPVSVPPVPPTPGVPPTGQGDPLAPSAPPPPASAPPPPPAPPVAEAPAPHAPPAHPAADSTTEDRNHPSYAPPTLSSGDPLAG